MRKLSSYGWVVFVGLLVRIAPGQVFSFELPSDDRWYYPFNFSAGSRPTASTFGTVASPGFNNRDAYVIVAWDTSTKISVARGPANYRLKSLRVTLTNQKNATWPVDLTPDEWFLFDLNGDGAINGDGIPRGEPGDADGESSDQDPGRSIELFGAGFGPSFTLMSWTETKPFVGSSGDADRPRDPFPFAFAEEGADVLHVEDNISGFGNPSLGVFPFTPQPWAVGVPQQYTPGNQEVPFDVVFEVDLDASQGRVREYFQNQLDVGRVVVIVSSLREAALQSSAVGYPSFFNKEGLALDAGAKAPRLDLELEPCGLVVPDLDGDCDVDEHDLALLNACWTGPAMTVSIGGCQSADFDHDSDVDQVDFSVWQRCFSGEHVVAQEGCEH